MSARSAGGLVNPPIDGLTVPLSRRRYDSALSRRGYDFALAAV